MIREIRSAFEYKPESHKSSKHSFSCIRLLSETGNKLGTFPKDLSKQKGNFGSLNQSQNKLAFLFRMGYCKGITQEDTFFSRRYI